jgi:ABC-2 type transport system ATP-binding protein
VTDAIIASELVKTYPASGRGHPDGPAPDGVRALDHLSLSVKEGTIFALLGPNGAGKSTTVKVLSTLTRPDSGRAWVGGIDVLADPRRVRQTIGVVGQRHGADPDATGRENLALQGAFYGMSGRELRRRVNESLDRFGLSDAADRRVKTYSGGMQRRLSLALGLIHQPRVLFLDEPTTGLDPEVRVAMWREIERLAREERTTILFTTHYLEEADSLAADLAIVDRGRVVATGTPESLKSELHGDTVQVELADADGIGLDSLDTTRLALDRVGAVDEVTVQDGKLRARARDGASAIPAVLGALEANGVRAAAVTLSRPSLADVYLRYAGRSFAAGDAEHQEVAA